jgi:hypothetical protein
MRKREKSGGILSPTPRYCRRCGEKITARRRSADYCRSCKALHPFSASTSASSSSSSRTTVSGYDNPLLGALLMFIIGMIGGGLWSLPPFPVAFLPGELGSMLAGGLLAAGLWLGFLHFLTLTARACVFGFNWLAGGLVNCLKAPLRWVVNRE